MNTILIDSRDDEATQNAFANTQEGQTVEVTLQVLISEKSDERIAGTIALPVDQVRRIQSDIDSQNNANELDVDDEEEEPESELPGGALRSIVDGS